MKKLLGIIVLGLLLSGNANTFEKKYNVFGIYLADDILAYNISKDQATDPYTVYVNPPILNDNFKSYIAHYNPKNRHTVIIDAIHRKDYSLGGQHNNLETIKRVTQECIIELSDYVNIITNGDQFIEYSKKDGLGNDHLPLYTYSIYLKRKDKTEFSIGLNCKKFNGLTDNDPVVLKGVISVMDHRNAKQAIKDIKEYTKKGFDILIDKSGLDGKTPKKEKKKKKTNSELES